MNEYQKKVISSLLTAALTFTLAEGVIPQNIKATEIETAGVQLQWSPPDRTAPKIKLNLSTYEWTNDDVIITADISDAGGIRVQKYASGNRNGSFFKSQGIEFTGKTFKVSTNGTYTVYARDNSENETVETIEVKKIDTNPPEILLSIFPPPLIYTKDDVTIMVNAMDFQSGVSTKKWLSGKRSIDDFNNEANEAEVIKGNSFKVSTNGTYTVYAKDNAGNEIVETKTVNNIDKEGPNISFSLSPNDWTNEDVWVTAAVSDIVGVRLKKYATGTRDAEYFYRHGNSFGTHFVAHNNQTFTVYAIDILGNETVEVIKIDNIDRTKPVLTLSASTTDPTNNDVTIRTDIVENQSGVLVKKWLNGIKTTSDFTDNGVLIDGNEFTVSTNGDYTVFVKDKAGNEVVSVINVSNIDRAAPAAATFTTNTATPTKENVNVTINFPNDAEIKKYKIGENGNWNDYTTTLTLDDNNVVYAKAQDIAGNWSEEASLTVSNIDKTAPIITIGAFNTNPTNQDIIVTASTNEGTLNAESYTFTSNGSFEFTATDAVGNVTKKTVTINNIDKTPPTAPQVITTPISPTNQKVTLSIVSEENASGEYSFDNINWINYIAPLEIEENKTVYVRCKDLSGNISATTIKTIDNIDRIAPEITINGVENNKMYDNVTKPLISLNEGTYTAKLNGNEYKGEDIASLGDHTLDIAAVDAAGNTSTKTIKFSIRAVLSNAPASPEELVKVITNSAINNVPVLLNGTTVLPKKLFEELINNKDLLNSNSRITFNVNSNGMQLEYSFNVKDIDKNNLKDIELALNEQPDFKDIIGKIDGNAQILSFKGSGTLPVDLSIRIKLDPTKLDLTKPVYFYYYNPTTKTVELIGSSLTADKDGYVQITIKHFSDYFFSNSNKEKISDSIAKLPKTGSLMDTNILVVIGLLFTAIGSIFIIGKKKRRAE